MGPAVDTTARSSDDGARLPSLDAVRGLAFVLVLGSHLRLPGADGALGVTVFFFLSGFLITTLLLREERTTGAVDLRAFYRRRAVRILPLFYVVLALCALLTAVGARDAGLQGGPVLAQLLHGSNYLFVYHGEAGTPIGTDTYWSLAVEEHFYVLFPLLALLAVRRRASVRLRLAVVLGLCGAVLAWRCWYAAVADDPVRVYLRTYLASDMRADGILAGAALALALDPGRLRARLPRPVRLAILPAGLVALLLVTRPQGLVYEATFETTLQAVALALVFTGALVEPPRVLQVRALTWLGSVSYAAYLLHRVVIEGLERALPERSPALVVAATLVTLALAEASRRWFELPLARWRGPGRPPSAGAQVPSPRTTRQDLGPAGDGRGRSAAERR